MLDPAGTWGCRIQQSGNNKAYSTLFDLLNIPENFTLMLSPVAGFDNSAIARGLEPKLSGQMICIKIIDNYPRNLYVQRSEVGFTFQNKENANDNKE